jgi:hypothetical protein
MSMDETERCSSTAGRSAIFVEAKQRWDTDELRRDFEVIGFMAPFVVVRRKSDGVKGSLEFTHSPRVYFNFIAD